MLILFRVLCGVAIILMAASLAKVIKLRKLSSSGLIGGTVNLLFGLISIFLLGYLVAPFFTEIPLEYALIAVAMIFIGGAIFVLVVLSMITDLVEKVLQLINFEKPDEL